MEEFFRMLWISLFFFALGICSNMYQGGCSCFIFLKNMKAYYKPRKSILKYKESIIVAQQRQDSLAEGS